MYIVHVNYFKETYSILGGSIRMIMSNFGSSHVISFDMVNSSNRGLTSLNAMRIKISLAVVSI